MTWYLTSMIPCRKHLKAFKSHCLRIEGLRYGLELCPKKNSPNMSKHVQSTCPCSCIQPYMKVVMMDSDGRCPRIRIVTNRRIDAKFLQAHFRPEVALIDMRSSAKPATKSAPLRIGRVGIQGQLGCHKGLWNGGHDITLATRKIVSHNFEIWFYHKVNPGYCLITSGSILILDVWGTGALCNRDMRHKSPTWAVLGSK